MLENCDCWFSLCDRMRHCGLSLFSPDGLHVEYGSLAQPKIFAAALMSRTLQNLLGVVVTARAGLLVEARTLTRSCVENLLWLRRLAADGQGFSQAIVDDSRHNDAGLAKRMLKGLSQLEEDDKNLILAKVTSGTGTRRISLVEGPAEDEAAKDYLLFKALSNDSAHPSGMSLGRHFPEDPATGQTQFEVIPLLHSDDLPQTLFYACNTVILAICFYSAIASVRHADDEIAACHAELARLAALPHS